MNEIRRAIFDTGTYKLVGPALLALRLSRKRWDALGAKDGAQDKLYLRLLKYHPQQGRMLVTSTDGTLTVPAPSKGSGSKPCPKRRLASDD